MPYKNPEKQKEAVRKAVAKSRGITQGITGGEDVIPSGPENVIPKVRINPMTKLPYGKGMLGLMNTPQGMAALAEYERKHGQTEPVYGTGSPSAWMARYAISEGFERIHHELGPYAGEVRVGCFGPTVEELYSATH